MNENPTIFSREYDASGHFIKEYVTYPNQPKYLLREYFYNDRNQLTEARSYSFNGVAAFTYLHEFNEEERTETVYKQYGLNEKVIQSDYAYDKQHRLIMSKSYTQGQSYLKHHTQTFIYGARNLVEMQIYQDTERDDYYYKHFYTFFH